MKAGFIAEDTSSAPRAARARPLCQEARVPTMKEFSGSVHLVIGAACGVQLVATTSSCARRRQLCELCSEYQHQNSHDNSVHREGSEAALADISHKPCDRAVGND